MARAWQPFSKGRGGLGTLQLPLDPAFGLSRLLSEPAFRLRLVRTFGDTEVGWWAAWSL